MTPLLLSSSHILCVLSSLLPGAGVAAGAAAVVVPVRLARENAGAAVVVPPAAGVAVAPPRVKGVA